MNDTRRLFLARFAQIKTRLATSVSAGFIAGMLLGIIDSLVASEFSFYGVLIAICASQMVTVPTGFLVGVLWLVQPLEGQALGRMLFEEGNAGAGIGGKVLAAGIIVLFGLALCYRLLLFCFTTFKHAGLAALLCTVVLCALLLAGNVIFFWLAPIFARGLVILKQREKRVPPAFVAACLLIVVYAAALLPPLLVGPKATGLFGFMGLLRVDGLGLAPLMRLAVVMPLGWVVVMIIKRKQNISRSALVLPLVGALFGLAIAGSALLPGNSPLATARLRSAAGIGSSFLQFAQKMSDRDGDGHGSLFGGGDCDEGKPQIHPGAAEIADNGIDEDCSGSDLRIAALEKLAPAVLDEPTMLEQKPLELPPNASLLFITVDTVRWDAPGYMGYHRDVTPNMDKLAKRGVIYDRAYALSSYTSQSVPAMLTGKYPSELVRNRKHQLRIGGQELFAAEAICPTGIRCKAIVSHFLFKRKSGWHQGFDDWQVIGMVPEKAPSTNHQYNAHLVADAAIKWLQQPENTRGRFWLWVHLMDPHRNYLEHEGVHKFGTKRRDLYDHELKWTDMQLGRILETFEKLEAAKRTVVLLTSDHGESFYEHGRCCHGYELWEENIRVPLIAVGPGVASRRISRPTSHVDLFPTFLDIFGFEIPKSTHGRSLLSEWRVDNQELPEVPVIADQTKNEKYAARRVFIYRGYKIHHLLGQGAFRFFALPKDYERGPSLPTAGNADFARIQAAYRLFIARELKLRAARPKVNVKAKTVHP